MGIYLATVTLHRMWQCNFTFGDTSKLSNKLRLLRDKWFGFTIVKDTIEITCNHRKQDVTIASSILKCSLPVSFERVEMGVVCCHLTASSTFSTTSLQFVPQSCACVCRRREPDLSPSVGGELVRQHLERAWALVAR